MATNSIRVDDDVKREATEIADQLGLSFNAVINVMLREFNRRRGFPFPVNLPAEIRDGVFSLDAREVERLCQQAVRERTEVAVMEPVTIVDPETQKLVKQYSDGRKEPLDA